MTIQETASLIAEQIRQAGWLQWAAITFGVTEVILAQKNRIALYPAGIAAAGISIYILWDAGLFAESLLNLYYVLMSMYGWWHWSKKKDQPPVAITKTTLREWAVVAAIILFAYLVLYLVLVNFTPSTVPHWDAWITATAWAGTWLLARRKLENWILLNISNAFAIPLLIQKELPLFAALTLVLFVVAVRGYFSWQKKMHAH